MTEVETAPRGHPGPMQSADQRDDVDRELDWMMRNDGQTEVWYKMFVVLYGTLPYYMVLDRFLSIIVRGHRMCRHTYN